MNTVAKGNRAENEAIQILSKRGHDAELIDKAVRRKFAKKIDLKGHFDIHSPYRGTDYYIQCKSNSTQGAIKEIREFLQEKGEHFHAGCIFQVWVRYDNRPVDKRWKVHTIKNEWCLNPN